MLGLVVSPENSPGSRISHTVFIKNDSPLLFIRPPDLPNLRELSKEERKLIEKEQRKKQLAFGDWIRFNENQVRGSFIEDYKKEFPLLESRCHLEFLQIKASCVFSPPAQKTGRRRCHSEFFGDVEVENSVAERFLANVVFTCWLSVNITRTSSLQVSFGEYCDICDTQELARCAPWNKHDPRFRLDLISIDPAAEEETDQESVSRLGPNDVAEIYDGCGVLSGERILYSQCFANFSIILGYLHPGINMEVGNRIEFDAVYNFYLNVYVVRRYCRAKGVLNFGNQVIDFGADCLLEVAVKSDESLPFGYLWTKEKSFGVVSDLNGLITPFLLGKNPQGVLSVLVEDTGPGQFCRFVIRQVTGNSVKKIEKAKQGVMHLPETSGFVLDGNMVFAPDFGTLLIRFDSKRFPKLGTKSPGCWISFFAEAPTSGEGRAIFSITNWKSVKEEDFQPIETMRSKDGLLYKALCNFDKEVGAFRSRIFGFIYDPKQVTLKIRKRNDLCVLWVMYNTEDARTPFTVHSASDGLAKNVSRVAANAKDIKLEPKLTSRDPVLLRTCHEEETIQPARLTVADAFKKPDVSSAVPETPYCGIFKPCQKPNCAGRDLIRRILNDRSIVNRYYKIAGDGPIVRMVLCTSQK